MFLSDTNLRYLFVIDDIARKKAAVSSMEVAQALGVTKPSVARVLESLMERGLVVKERYGKVYLTDRGAFTARYYHDIVRRILHSFPEMPFPLTEEQKYGAACAMAAVTGIGFAEAIGQKLAAVDPEKYGLTAEKLRIKAERAAQRRKEQQAHERNVRRGGKKHGGR